MITVKSHKRNGRVVKSHMRKVVKSHLTKSERAKANKDFFKSNPSSKSMHDFTRDSHKNILRRGVMAARGDYFKASHGTAHTEVTKKDIYGKRYSSKLEFPGRHKKATSLGKVNGIRYHEYNGGKIKLKHSKKALK